MWTRPNRIPLPTSERALADAWAEHRYAGHWLVDCCGRHLRVVYPGRRWGGPGPDFHGAVLAQRDGTLVRGDVEIHVRASSWQRHGHGGDAAYARVVLHVVAWADALVLDSSGTHIPTVVLDITSSGERTRGRPASAKAWPPGPCLRQSPALLEVVRAAGRERFRARAARFEGDLTLVAPDQVVWRGVAEALGYSRNAAAFAALADAVPWSLAADVVRAHGMVSLAGLLLGTAGLLAEATLAEAHAWRLLQRRRGARQALSGAVWERGQGRAANAPAVRCRGLAALANQWSIPTAPGRSGPAEYLEVAVDAATRARHQKLWASVHAPPWIGRGRAQVVAVNVVLPFAYARGMPEAATLFERCPGEPTNRIVRYMADQLSGSLAAPDPGSCEQTGSARRVRFRGACLQQGLLHLFSQTCASRLCEACPAADRRGMPGIRRAPATPVRSAASDR